MKYFLFFVILINFIQPIQSQFYKADLNLDVKANSSGSYGDGCRNDIEVIVVFTDNSQLILLDEDLNGVGRSNYVNYTSVKDYNVNKDVEKVIVKTSRNWKRLLGGCGGDGSFNNKPVENSISFCDNEFDEFSDGKDDDDIASWWDVRFDLNFYPVITITDPLEKNSFPTDDNILIQSTPGYRERDYNWEYSFDTKNWEIIRDFQGSSRINASIQDILSSSNIDLMHGRKIYIRINICDNRYSEKEVTYNIRKSAPHISSISRTSTTCFDAEDGKVKIKFDRPLKSRETLSIALQKYDEINGVYEDFTPDMDGDGNPDTSQLDNLTAFEADNSFLIHSLPQGNYKINLLGFYNGSNTYTEGTQHSINFKIDRHKPVEFSAKGVNVWCNGGQDGEIAITASGGVGNYEYILRLQGETTQNWLPFSSATSHVIKGLIPDRYEILVRDSNGCYAKKIVYDGSGNIVGLGDIIIEPVEITEPATPVGITYTYSKEPTAYGFDNGIIVAQITGGKPLLGGRYNYTWTYQDGTIWTSITPEVTPEGYFLTLNGAPAGIYKLTVTDANYNSATNKEGCTIQESEFELTQPDPLEVTLSVYQEISCHQKNEFGDETDINPQDGQRDESQDGAILASVTGGVQFSSGSPYIYTWKKQNTDGSWITLTNQTNNISTELSDGNYAFNVEDANGIIFGEYVNNSLVKAVDSIMYLHEPEQLKLNLTSTPTTCASGSNGTIQASVMGGTPPYTYYWSNGEVGSMDMIANLSPNNYFVQIIDAKGCQVQGNIEVKQPDDYYIEIVEKKNPTCFGGDDGSIDIMVFGGMPPYSYNWDTGDTTEDIDNLVADNYSISVTDAMGCTLFKEIVVENPDEIIIDLGDDRVLCNEQSLLLDATIDDIGATYQWTSSNGFTASTPQVEVSKEGVYYITATTSLGCVVKDEITITTSDEDISAEFLLSTQAYTNEEVILVNVSSPRGEVTEWLVPPDVTINNEKDSSIHLMFSKAGSYIIGLRSRQGACFQEFYKNVIVEKSTNLPNTGDVENPFIKEFLLSPNPNNGAFHITISLAKESPISVRIFNMSGALVTNERMEYGSDTYTLNYNEAFASGVYLVVLETANKTQVKRMVRF